MRPEALPAGSSGPAARARCLCSPPVLAACALLVHFLAALHPCDKRQEGGGVMVAAGAEVPMPCYYFSAEIIDPLIIDAGFLCCQSANSALEILSLNKKCTSWHRNPDPEIQISAKGRSVKQCK